MTLNSKELLKKITNWDRKITLKYNGIGGKPFTYFLKVLSFFGRETFWVFLTFFFLFVYYNPFLSTYIGTTFLNGVVFILPIKIGVKRLRPFRELDKVEVYERRPTSESFPSWHAYNASSQAFLLGTISNNLIFFILLTIMATFIAFSRIQFGVHYITDVIVGFLIGIIGFLCAYSFGGSFFLSIIKFFESLLPFSVSTNTFNPLLFNTLWYQMLMIIVFGTITLSAIYKYLKELIKRKNRIKQLTF